LDYVRPGFLILTLFIYWISYEALYHPEVFSVIRGYAGDATAVADELPKLKVHLPEKKYRKSNLNEDEIVRIIDSLTKLMDEQKPYLDPSVNIDGLATMISSNRHHLSQVLNERLKKSFYDYVNYFRVEEAKLTLSDPAKMHYKIASIAYDAGFNSLSTFNEVFRKATGLTPSQYRKQPFRPFKVK
jgi:AraC-like DNA-binding protein